MTSSYSQHQIDALKERVTHLELAHDRIGQRYLDEAITVSDLKAKIAELEALLRENQHE